MSFKRVYLHYTLKLLLSCAHARLTLNWLKKILSKLRNFGNSLKNIQSRWQTAILLNGQFPYCCALPTSFPENQWSVIFHPPGRKCVHVWCVCASVSLYAFLYKHTKLSKVYIDKLKHQNACKYSHNLVLVSKFSILSIMLS